QLRAIMPSSVLLPTPEPAKMPMRWPRPQVSRPSRARTPVASGVRIGWRPSGFGGASVIRAMRDVLSGPLPSIGRASPSMTRPSSSSPTGTENPRPLGNTAVPGRTPCVSANGIRISRSSRKPTTSAVMREPPAVARSGYRWQMSPSGSRRPSTSMLRPTTWTTRPWKRRPEERATSWRCDARSSIGTVLGHRSGIHIHGERPQRIAELLKLALELGVHLTMGRFDDGAAGLHALVWLELDAIGGNPRRNHLGPAAPQQLGVGGVDPHAGRGSRVHLIQRGTDDVHRHVGNVLDFALDHLLGDLQREIDHLSLGGAEEGRMVLLDVGHQRGQAGDRLRRGFLGGSHTRRVALLESDVVALQTSGFLDLRQVRRKRQRHLILDH